MLKKFSNNFANSFSNNLANSLSSSPKGNPLCRAYCWLARRVWLAYALAGLLLFGYVLAKPGWYLMLVLFIQTVALIISK